jgi:hypothetical protein
MRDGAGGVEEAKRVLVPSQCMVVWLVFSSCRTFG